MISIQSIIILLGLVTIAWACAPSVHRSHGYCEYYVDGSSDLSERSKRSGEKGSHEGKAKGKKFNRMKKKKDVECYLYEDGSKDTGATLEEGVEEPENSESYLKIKESSKSSSKSETKTSSKTESETITEYEYESGSKTSGDKEYTVTVEETGK